MSRGLFLGALSAAALAFVVAACGQGPAESAGEKADSAFENVTQGQEDRTDGPMENAGERIDNAATSAEAARERTDDAQTPNTTP